MRNDKGGGARKYDRNRNWCKAYRLREQREVNKVKRLVKHLKRYPEDASTRAVLDGLPAHVKRRALGPS